MQFRPLAIAPTLLAVAALLGLLVAGGCSTAYYNAFEQVGQHKRDILKSRIEAGRQDQQEAQEQFKTTYERFAEAANYDGGDLESVYDRLNREYERSTARADDVSDRIVSIEKVSADLFDEWEQELELIQNPKLRNSSAESLRSTEARYGDLIAAMKRAEAKMPPVLAAFRDQVLFLKHNLNARAIAALEGTLGAMESDVASLIRDIDVSIREADRFLDTLEDEA
jgi:hypothetical protein